MLNAQKYMTFSKVIETLVEDIDAADSAQIKCIEKYLKELDVQSFVVEHGYTDAGYLVDYSNYYSRCHADYKKVTKRVHFFSTIESTLNQETASYLKDNNFLISFDKNYLGFVVIKPLPETIIGRTCLATYPERDDFKKRKRVFPISRNYNCSLNGFQLKVKSIAFQQQDREIAACATAAIWFALHGLVSKITTESIPSPFEITNSSSDAYIKRAIGEISRRFPTSGLSLEQIETYFRGIGLDCIVCGIQLNESTEKLKDYLSSYVRGGHPMIVVGKVYSSNEKIGDYSLDGLHAITALGYAEKDEFTSGAGFGKIEKLYAHDDNIGPFTSFHFNDCNHGGFSKFLKHYDPNTKYPEDDVRGYLSNESGLKNSGFVYRKIIPSYFVIPINQKIRLPSEIITTFAKQFTVYFEKLKLEIYRNKAAPEISWELNLEQNKVTKKLILDSTDISTEVKAQLLLLRMPKYIWRLSFTARNTQGVKILFDILFDATDLLQNAGVLAVVNHTSSDSDTVFSFMCRSIRSWVLSPGGVDFSVSPIMKSFYRSLNLDKV